MAQLSFGSILQNERERKGYDILTVARKLRVRPDIIAAIEASDFSRIPPRGYARNMVNAYARYLGLNPTEITRLYLDEAYADQVRNARSSARSTGFDMPNTASGRRSSTSRHESSLDEDISERISGTGGRVLLVDNTSSRYRNRNLENNRVYPEERTHRSTRSAVPGTQYTNFYAGPSAQSSLRAKLPLIIAGGVILVLLIVFLVFIISPKGDAGDDVQKVPVTGVDDTTQTPTESEEGDTPQQPVAVAPDKVVVEYEVAAGQSAWIDIYENGTVIEGSQVTAGSEPVKKGFNVTGTLRIDTPQPSAVRVTQDGVELAWTDEDGDSVYSITVDFAAILAQWHVDNPPTSSGEPENGSGASDTGGTSG